MIRTYYKARSSLMMEAAPYIIAKGQLFTEYEVRKYRLTGLVDESFLEPVQVDHMNTWVYWYQFRFQKGDINVRLSSA